MRIPSGKTDQLIFFVAVDSLDRLTRKTGLSSFTVYRSRNGGTATVYTTPTVAELSAANMPGVYALTVDEDTTIASGSDSEEYAVHITCSTMAPVTRTIELYRRDTTSGRTLDVSAGGEAGVDWGNVGSPTTAVDLTNTTIKVTQKVDVDTIKTNAVVNGGTITFPSNATLASTANVTAVPAAVWDMDATAHQTQGTFGQAIGDPGADADTIWGLANTNLDAAVTSRMASYTQPSGFLAAAFPGTVASTTNLTAGTVTTATNVTTVNGLAAGVITATSIADDAITAAKVANGAIDAATFASGALDAVWSTATRLLTAGTNIVLAKGTGVTGFNDIAAGAAMTLTAAYDAAKTAATQTSVDDLPTNAELATALAAADDAVLAAVAALNNLSQANVRSAVGLATANLDTQLGDLPTNAELATALGTADDAVLAAIAALNNLSAAQVNAEADTALADVGLTVTVTGRIDAAVSSRASQTSVDDLPTNAELATALGTADDAVLAAIAALNNLSQANVRTAVGLATANLDTQLDALPTNAELTTALAAADDAVLAAVAALNNLSQANVRTAVGLATANLDTQLDALPTNAELATALGTADDAVLAAIAALNNLSQANVRTAVGLATANLDTQLTDLPTNAELATALAAADDAVLAAIAALTAPDNASITAIKTKTDSLTFTVPGVVDSNIKRVTDIAVDGVGTEDDPWGPV